MTDLIPLYALYASLFADSGMSDAQISALFAIWSIVGIAAEVPSALPRWLRGSVHRLGAARA